MNHVLATFHQIDHYVNLVSHKGHPLLFQPNGVWLHIRYNALPYIHMHPGLNFAKAFEETLKKYLAFKLDLLISPQGEAGQRGIQGQRGADGKPVRITCNGFIFTYSNSSNTSRITPSDFQTPRGVENTRRSQVFFNERRGILKSEEDLSPTLEYLSVLFFYFSRKSW